MAREESDKKGCSCRKILFSRYTAYTFFLSLLIGSVILTGHLTVLRCNASASSSDVQASANCEKAFPDDYCKKHAFSTTSKSSQSSYDVTATIECPFTAGPLAAYYLSFVFGVLFLATILIRRYKKIRLIYTIIAGILSAGLLVLTVILMCIDIAAGRQYFAKFTANSNITYSSAIYIGNVILVIATLFPLLPLIFITFKGRANKKDDASNTAEQQQKGDKYKEDPKKKKAANDDVEANSDSPSSKGSRTPFGGIKLSDDQKSALGGKKSSSIVRL